MKKVLEMSPEKAKELYNNEPSLRDWLLENFTESELKGKPTQEEFDKVFLNLIEEGKKNVNFIEGTYYFELRDSNGGWLFDISYDSKNPCFWFNYDKVYCVFQEKFGLEYFETQKYMRNVLDNHLKMKGTTPFYQTNV